MSLESDKKQNNNDFDSMLSPFLKNNQDKSEIKTFGGRNVTSPLDAVRTSLHKNTETAKKDNDAKKETDTKKEVESQKSETAVSVKKAYTEHPTAEISEKQTVVKRSTLLAKCMPFIYDDGVNYAEEKPDYTLDSVEDIIESAEKRADEKLARMYRIKTSDIQRIGSDNPNQKKEEIPTAKPKLRLEESSIKKSLRIGEVAKTTPRIFDTVSIPKITETLFDDFSARRTDISGDEKITVPYSTEGGMDLTNDDITREIPQINKKTRVDTFEDISSNTRVINTEEIFSSSKKVLPKVTSFSEEEPEIDVNDFSGKQDIVRVGTSLKVDCFTSKLRLIVTLIATVLAASVHIPFFTSSAEPMTLNVISIIAFGVAFIVNFGIFTGFKKAFSSETKAELPIALACVLMTVYYLYSTITAKYNFTSALIPLISLLFYDFCIYKKSKAIFGNFKLIALRKTKSAITLIDEPSVTSAMARSVITGEILAAGERETEEIHDFLKHTLSERPFGGKLNILSVVSCCAALVTAVSVGLSHSSIADAILSAGIMLCIGAMPSLYIADILPFSATCGRLKKVRAAVCSKYSAERIEQINAAVVSSTDLFPEGTIKLYDMRPLSANNLDTSLVLAAAVAKEANSPLYHLFADIIDDESEIPIADTVKYEETLGISGWAKDTHILIGNRSLMQAHGVRIPDLNVDRKILHRGYFPIYVACEQRACALIVISYSVNREIERELSRLCDRGITLLVSNCDPNITEDMLCDYFGLYSDLVKILDHNGKDKYEGQTSPTEAVSAHAFHKGNILSYLKILNSVFMLRTLSTVLYVIHILAAAVMWLLFAGAALGGTLTLMSIPFCAFGELICIIIALTAYFIGK